MRFLRGALLVAICALVTSPEASAVKRSFVASCGAAGTSTLTMPWRTFDDAITRTTIVGYVHGVFAAGSGGTVAVVNIAQSAIAGNSIGVQANDGGYVRLTANQIDGNAIGTSSSGTGTIASLGNNLRHGNTTEGVAVTPLTPY